MTKNNSSYAVGSVKTRWPSAERKHDLGGISFFFGALRAPKKNEIPFNKIFHAAAGCVANAAVAQGE